MSPVNKLCTNLGYRSDTDESPPNSTSRIGQANLKKHLQQANVLRWPTERLLFHGCTDHSKHTNVILQLLDGDFKWLSESPTYATDYAFFSNSGKPFLFVCTLQREAIAIMDSQRALHHLTNWGTAAPWRFPVEFGSIARKALSTEEPIIFLDHFHEDTSKWAEILVPNPSLNLSVIDTIPLPGDKEEAKRIVENLYY